MTRLISSLCVALAIFGAAAIVTAPTESSAQRKNWSLGGGHYNKFERDGMTWQTCRDLCRNDRQCRAWTYVRGRFNSNGRPYCLRYRYRPAGSPSNCCVAGYVRGGGGGGGGNKAQYCRNYANSAVNSHRLNVRRRCGYRGTRWQYSYANHYNWCMRVSRNSSASESRARSVALQRCRGGGGGGGNKATFCRTYANRAVSQHRTNVNRRCGYRGTRWQYSYGNHYNWCMRVNPSRARSEDRARNVALQRCRGGGGGGGQVVRFNFPRVNGAIVDWCQRWATNCGWGGAHQYCRVRGYRQATAWQTYRPGRTYVIGSRRFCRGRVCKGFRYVNCRR